MKSPEEIYRDESRVCYYGRNFHMFEFAFIEACKNSGIKPNNIYEAIPYLRKNNYDCYDIFKIMIENNKPRDYVYRERFLYADFVKFYDIEIEKFEQRSEIEFKETINKKLDLIIKHFNIQ